MSEYRFGVEEEYFVIDRRSRNVRQRMPAKFLRDCQAKLGKQVTSELLQAQIEVNSLPCRQMDEARQQLAHLRTSLAACAGRYGLEIVAAATHPLAVWHQQQQTAKSR